MQYPMFNVLKKKPVAMALLSLVSGGNDLNVVPQGELPSFGNINEDEAAAAGDVMMPELTDEVPADIEQDEHSSASVGDEIDPSSSYYHLFVQNPVVTVGRFSEENLDWMVFCEDHNFNQFLTRPDVRLTVERIFHKLMYKSEALARKARPEKRPICQLIAYHIFKSAFFSDQGVIHPECAPRIADDSCQYIQRVLRIHEERFDLAENMSFRFEMCQFKYFPARPMNIFFNACPNIKRVEFQLSTGITVEDIELLSLRHIDSISLAGLRLNQLPALHKCTSLKTVSVGFNWITSLNADRYSVRAFYLRNPDLEKIVSLGTSINELSNQTLYGDDEIFEAYVGSLGIPIEGLFDRNPDLHYLRTVRVDLNAGYVTMPQAQGIISWANQLSNVKGNMRRVFTNPAFILIVTRRCICEDNFISCTCYNAPSGYLLGPENVPEHSLCLGACGKLCCAGKDPNCPRCAACYCSYHRSFYLHRGSIFSALKKFNIRFDYVDFGFFQDGLNVAYEAVTDFAQNVLIPGVHWLGRFSQLARYLI